jgi:hypothetical protein
MKEAVQKLVKSSKSIIKVDARLNHLIGQDLFPQKTARANKYGAAVKVRETK